MAFGSQNSFSWCFVNDMNVSSSHLAASSARLQFVADGAQLSARSVPSVGQERPGLLEVLAAMLLFVSAGIDWYAVCYYRVEPLGVPINIIDILMFGLVPCALLRAFRGVSHARRIPGTVSIPAAVFALASVIGLIEGVGAGYRLYDVVQDFRIAVYLLLFFWLFTLTPLRHHLGVLTWAWIAGSLAAAFQILHGFASGYSETGLVYAGRAVVIPAPSLVFAILVLAARQQRAWGFVWRSVRYACISLFLVAILLTLTRAVWLILVVALCVFTLVGRQARRTALLVLSLAVLAGVSAGALAIFPTELPEELRTRAEAFTLFVQGEERGTLYTRAEEIAMVSRKFPDHPVFGHGLGTTTIMYVRGGKTAAEATFLHNSVAFYLLKLGAVGALAFFGFLGVVVFRTLKVPPGSDLFPRARLVFAAVTGFALAGNFSGYLNHTPYMILLGFLLAQSVLLSSAAPQPARRQVRGAP